MRTTKIVLLLSIFLGVFHTMQAQVKIGDNPLNIGADRMLEIENTDLGLGEFFIISDSLRIGRTTSTGTYDPFTDALMLKLYGYGLGSFTGTQSYFLGTNTNGEVLEFPLTLDLSSNSSNATLSLNNGTTLFGDVSLNPLDSIFATDTEVRTLVAESASSDGDTLTGNEWIENITISSSPNITLTFFEDTLGPDSTRNESSVNLGPIVPRKFDVDTTFVNVRNELADTAQALRNQIFYKIDGTLDEDRTLTGLDFSLTFTDVDSFTVNGDNVTVTGTGTTDISTVDDLNLSSSTGGVNIDGDNVTVTGTATTDISTTDNLNLSSTSGDVNIDGDNIAVTGTGNTDIITTDSINLTSNSGNVNIEGATGVNVTGTVNILDYGTGPVPGTETNILGVTATGEIVEVSLDSIGGDATLSGPVDLDENGVEETTVDEAIQAANLEIDSTIYNYNGTLDEDRTLTGSNHSLTFTDVDSFTVNGGNVTVTGTATTDISTTDDLNLSSTSGDVNIDGDNIAVTGTGTTDISTTDNLNLSSTSGDVNIAGDNIAVTGTGNTDIITTDSINLTSNSGNVNIDGATGVNVTGTVNILDYGTGPVPGTETNILGVTATGEIVEVSLDSIGGDATLSGPVDLDENGVEETTVDEAIQAANLEIDSTIYNYNGTLTGERTMEMAGNTLYFIGGGAGDTIMFGSNGTMAIGKSAPLTGTTNGIRLDVNGDILAMQVHSSSDRRFKKNIQKVSGALDKVKAIEGVTYDFRLDEFKNRNFPTTKQLGFIAQNVETVVPEVVRTNADGYKAVDYSKMTALLNEAIKEQQVQIEEQAALIKSQQALVLALLSNQETLTQEIAEVKASIKEVSNQTMSEE